MAGSGNSMGAQAARVLPLASKAIARIGWSKLCFALEGLRRGRRKRHPRRVRSPDYPLFIALMFAINRKAHERRNSSNWDHRRQWSLSNRRIARRNGTQRRYAIRAAVGHAGWRK